jgi:hypothetical protein
MDSAGVDATHALIWSQVGSKSRRPRADGGAYLIRIATRTEANMDAIGQLLRVL